MMRCSSYKLPEFENDCKPLPIAISGLPMKVFYNPDTKEVFDENKIYMGKGTLNTDGEFQVLNVECDYHERKERANGKRLNK